MFRTKIITETCLLSDVSLRYPKITTTDDIYLEAEAPAKRRQYDSTAIGDLHR